MEQAKIEQLLGQSVAALQSELGTLSRADLVELQAAEVAGQNRSTLLAAIDKQLQALDAAEQGNGDQGAATAAQGVGETASAAASDAQVAPVTMVDPREFAVVPGNEQPSEKKGEALGADVTRPTEAGNAKDGNESPAAGGDAVAPAAEAAGKIEPTDWRHPDYTGPFDGEQAQWRLANIKPVTGVVTK